MHSKCRCFIFYFFGGGGDEGYNAGSKATADLKYYGYGCVINRYLCDCKSSSFPKKKPFHPNSFVIWRVEYAILFGK